MSTSASPSNIGEIAGYSILREIGIGSRSRIFLAQNRTSGRMEALRMPSRPATPPGGRHGAELLKQVRTLQRVSCENLLRIHGAPASKRYIAAEYVASIPLTALIQAHLGARTLPLIPMDQFRWIIWGICRALAAAHKAGVLHLNLTPNKIILSKDALDPKSFVRVGGFSVELEVLGLPLIPNSDDTAFLAPEVRQGKRIVDQRADVYSVGAILYGVLSGQLYRDEFGVEEDALPATDFELIPPTDLCPTLPKKLDEIVKRALSEDPEDRYRSINQFMVALNAIPWSNPVAGFKSLHRDVVTVFHDRDEAFGLSLPGRRGGEQEEVTSTEAIPQESTQPEIEESTAVAPLPPPAPPVRRRAPSPRPAAVTAAPTPRRSRSWLTLTVVSTLFLIFVIAFSWALLRVPLIQVELAVSPEDAKVVVDGRPMTERSFKLPPGRHQLFIQKEGYVALSETFQVCTPNEGPVRLVKRLSPRSAELEAEARQAFTAGDFETAIRLFEQHLEVEPTDFDALMDLGRALEFTGKDQQAHIMYQRALAAASSPRHVEEATKRLSKFQ